MPHASEPFTLPFPVLVGDIGGTNARFALIEAAASDLKIFPTAATADYDSPDAAIEAVVLKDGVRPKTLIFALAGPVTGERIKLTNCPWIFEPRELIRRLGVENVILLNDFEAQALALPSLGSSDLHQIGGGTALDEATKVVIGPGTGLGVGFLVRAEDKWIPIPSEGGHMTLAVESDRDVEIWRHLTRVEGRVTAESVISGPGLLNLYSAIARANGHEPHLRTPAEVTGAARSGDPEVKEALDLFGQHLGCVSGDFALTALARGGVYIGGGVSLHLKDELDQGPFRAAFEAKPPLRALATSIPTFLITHPLPALIGLSAYARHPSGYGVDLKGRHWSA